MKINSHRRIEFERGMKLALASSLFAAAACFGQSGALDLSFNPGSGPGPSDNGAFIGAICLTPNGQILVAGEFTTFNGFPSDYVARLNADGSFDQTFYVGTGPNTSVATVASEANGMVVIGGGFTMVNGEFQPNGAFYAVGSFSTVNGIAMHNIARFNADGSLDTSFSPAAVTGGSAIQSLAVQSNGFIVIGGNFTTVGAHSCEYLARLNSSGAVDTSFLGPGSIGGGSLTAVIIETNGQIVVGGDFASINGYSELGVARLNYDGSLDTTFRAPLVNATSVGTIALQSNGKIIELASPEGLVRLNMDGSLDTSFTAEVFGSSSRGLAVQADGKILIGGGSMQVNGTNINRIARLLGDSGNQAGVQLLSMNLYPGMFLSGSVGTNYRVEYTTNLSMVSLWTPLTNLTLTNSPAFIADPTLPQGSRFYGSMNRGNP